jgi:acyl carrier protein
MDNVEIIKELVVQQLKGIIKKTLELESIEQIRTDNLVEDLQLNSIDAMEILVWIENEYEIIFDDDEINVELMSSLNGLAEKVLTKINNK